MRRLRERADLTSPIELDAIELLRAAERYRPLPGAKQRVRAKLLERRAAPPPRALRPAIVVAGLLCAAGASAAFGRSWIARAYHRWAAEHEVPAASLAALPARPQGSTTEIAGTVVDDDRVTLPETADLAATHGTSVRAEPPAGVETNAQANAAAPRGAEGATERQSSKPSARPGDARGAPAHAGRRPVEPSADESTLVFDAMRALRQEGRPDRASKLLAEYARRFPNGSLSEEALALSIEAAVTEGDPRAKDLARDYLARYPAGQFREAAERARARFAP